MLYNRIIYAKSYIALNKLNSNIHQENVCMLGGLISSYFTKVVGNTILTYCFK